MRLENAVAADVLERILSAYGFTMQKQLSDKLGIAKSNVASWLQRGQVPGNVLVQCALDTGVNVQWLVNGEFANANNLQTVPCNQGAGLTGQHLIQKMLSSGGKPVLLRILDAYGFKTQKDLSEHLGISTGTISTWVRRAYFPGDVVISCAIDTGASLYWLATGLEYYKELGVKEPSIITNSIPKRLLRNGQLFNDGEIDLDKSLYFNGNCKPIYIEGKNIAWVTDFTLTKASNGKWLIDIDGDLDVYKIKIQPKKKMILENFHDRFVCDKESVTIIAKVIMTIEFDS